MVDRHRLIGECRKLKQDGVDLESVVAYLRDEGCWKIDCIAILREVLGISLGDAKRLVYGSSTWRDVREQDDTFHDELIDALVEKSETRKVNWPVGRIGAEGVFRRFNIRRFIAACARDCFQSIGPATPKRSVSSASADLGRRQRDGSCAGLVVEWRITPEPVIGPRFARTRWAPIRPTGCGERVQFQLSEFWPVITPRARWAAPWAVYKSRDDGMVPLICPSCQNVFAGKASMPATPLLLCMGLFSIF
jgi:hypothetical protein